MFFPIACIATIFAVLPASTYCSMTTALFTEFFPDNELQKVLQGRHDTKKIREEKFSSNLLSAPSKIREQVLTCYLKRLQIMENSPHRELAGALYRQFLEAFENNSEEQMRQFSDPMHKLVESVSASFHWCLESHIQVDEVGKMPEFNYPLSAFGKIADVALKGDLRPFFLQETAVNVHAQKNPAIRASINEFEKQNQEGYPYSVIQAGNSPKMVIIGTPRADRHDTVNRFFKAMIENDVQVIVTLNTAADWHKAIAYYTKGELEKVNVNGWIVRCVRETELYCGLIAANLPRDLQEKMAALTIDQREKALRDDSLKEYRPRIIERTLQASDGKILTQLHYINWPDRQAATDLDALMVLVKRQMQLLREKRCALAIHCQGGIGRTNFQAIVTWLLSEIDQKQMRGQDVKEAVFNIPEMMYELKRQAARLGGGICSLRCAHMYYVADAYYKARISESFCE